MVHCVLAHELGSRRNLGASGVLIGEPGNRSWIHLQDFPKGAPSVFFRGPLHIGSHLVSFFRRRFLWRFGRNRYRHRLIMDTNVARNVVVSLAVAVVLILSGMYVYHKLSQPEFIPIVSRTSDGYILLENGDPNPNYLTGMTRILYEWLTILLPYGAAALSLDKRASFDYRIPLISIVTILLLTFCGIRLFKNKDIK